MKRYLIFGALAASLILAYSLRTDFRRPPQIAQFEPKAQELQPNGFKDEFILSQGTLSIREVSLNNNSALKAIEIVKASASCGCTRLSFDGNIIPAKGTVKGHIQLLASPLVGMKVVYVAIEWKFVGDSKVNVYTSSFRHITKGVANIFPPDIFLGDVSLAVNQTKTIDLPVVQLTSFDGKYEWSKVNVETTEPIEYSLNELPHEGFEMHSKLKVSGASIGFHQSTIKFHLMNNGAEVGSASMLCRYYVGGDIQVVPEDAFDVISDASGKLPLINITDKSKTLKCIDAVSSDPNSVQCSLHKVETGWSLEFHLTNPKANLLRGTAVVEGMVDHTPVVLNIPYKFQITKI